VDARNWHVLHVEPSGIPVPDGLVGSKSRKYSSGAEHERHASTLHHDLVLGLLLDSIEKFPEANIRTDFEVTLTKSHEVREEEKGIGTYVVWMEAISAKH
jgi:hypothetical protein